VDSQGILISRIEEEQTIQWQKKDKRTNSDLQNITQKTKDRPTRTPLKTGGGGIRCSGRVNSFCSTCNTRRVTVKRHEHHMIRK
jgi:molybdenum cofactor biosynthesis enzyme MoaA